MVKLKENVKENEQWRKENSKKKIRKEEGEKGDEEEEKEKIEGRSQHGWFIVVHASA